MQQISPNAKIHPTAIIGPNVIIEGDVEIGPYCLIGLPAEKKGATEDKGVDIKQGAKLFGHCTIDSGTERATIIGEDVWLMKGAHVGHDAIIGANCVLSCHCAIGGHVVLSENCNIALNSSVHQYLELPEGTMLGMNSCLTKKAQMQPFEIWAGVPARRIKTNEVLLNRLKL